MTIFTYIWKCVYLQIYVYITPKRTSISVYEQALVGFKTPNICSNAATDAFPHLMHRHQEVFQKFEK